MTPISAKDVKALRDPTGAGILASRDALTEAGGDIERCEERCGAMPDIGVGPALGHPGHHWQNGLLAVERLDLAFLVYAEYQRPVGRREI